MQKNRLNKLEAAAGGTGGPGDNVQIIVGCWGDEVTARYVVDGVEYSEIGFRRRWPDWKPGQVDVKVDWD